MDWDKPYIYISQWVHDICDQDTNAMERTGVEIDIDNVTWDAQLNVDHAHGHNSNIRLSCMLLHAGVSKHDLTDRLARTACNKQSVNIHLGYLPLGVKIFFSCSQPFTKHKERCIIGMWLICCMSFPYRSHNTITFLCV